MLTLYFALLVITAVCGITRISSQVREGQLHHEAGLSDYLGIAWVASSLATLGGALGAALESDLAVREATYGYRPTERSEAGRAGS